MNDRGIIAAFLLSILSKFTNPENTTHFKLIKDHNSKKVNDLLIHKTIPVTLYINLLTIRDTGTQFELKGYLLKMITNESYNVDLASLSDKKSRYDFAKEMYFDIEAWVNESTQDRTLIRFLKSLCIMASGISTIFQPSDSNELCDRTKFLLQEEQAGNNSDLVNEEINAIVDNLLEYTRISKKQHKQILIKCNIFQTRKKKSINTHIVGNNE